MNFGIVYIKHAIAEVEAIEIILKKIEKCKKSYLIFEVEMPYRKLLNITIMKMLNILYLSQEEKDMILETLIDCCKFKDEITHDTDINISQKLTGIDDLIYVDVHGKLCCTKTLESAIKLVKYNEGEN